MVSFRHIVPGLRPAFREALDALASLVFPAPCRICEATLITASRIPVCPSCLASFQPLRGAACKKCGRPFVSDVAAAAPQPLCHLCRRDVYNFDLARSFAAYTDAMVRAIVLLKYHAVTPLGGWFATRLEEMVARDPDAFAADVVVPVPLHVSRLRERGYNQAELIARPLAKRLGLPLRSYLLVRMRPRPDKLKLTRKERWRTVRGAYAMREDTSIDKVRVLLVDDVFTTGATLDACARVLREAGAGRVVALTVARVAPEWLPVSTAVNPKRARQ
ncbi:MAG: ComF family protein [Acidobacteria bacterium]|nr:ComF family protein [Acidobacteriota bacterium]MBI3662122.1 ComF family protein [Acidobacteriota bacterium]